MLKYNNIFVPFYRLSSGTGQCIFFPDQTGYPGYFIQAGSGMIYMY